MHGTILRSYSCFLYSVYQFWFMSLFKAGIPTACDFLYPPSNDVLSRFPLSSQVLQQESQRSYYIGFLVSSGIVSIISAFVWRPRYFLPLALLGSSALTSGAILFSTLSTDTPFSKWFGYEILAGAGIGICRLVWNCPVRTDNRFS